MHGLLDRDAMLQLFDELDREPSPRHLLAMKLLAARNVDYRDTRLLIEHLALESPADAERIYKDLFPEEELKTAAREHIDRAFGELRAARTAKDGA